MMDSKEQHLSPLSLRKLETSAREGDRLVLELPGDVKPKVIWSGLGNPSGLHSFADTINAEQWAKSGARLMKKLAGLTAGTVTVMVYRNITRDRGRWVAGQAHRIDNVADS